MNEDKPRSTEGLEDSFSSSVTVEDLDFKRSTSCHKDGSSDFTTDKFASVDNDKVNETMDSQEMCGDEEKKSCEPDCVDGSSSFPKTSESCKTSYNVGYGESERSSACRESTNTEVSDESVVSSLSNSICKHHKTDDLRWEVIQAVGSRDGALGPRHFRLLKRLGHGDIGTVYLAQLIGSECYFAIKVMDKASLASRKKLFRAQIEREILQSLDHPFLPTLYAHFETDRFSSLVMEVCPGGDLHTLRQRQPGKYFPEQVVKFYVAEVLLGLEYLHMLGIIYRDLKPENILVREDGHIMLSDFDLSLRCSVSPTVVKTSPSRSVPKPSCAVPATCFSRRRHKQRKSKIEIGKQDILMPELIAEPSDARSMSFVGTHEYLAPEIIKGEGHGSAVDWWTFGIFMYELLLGTTPFKGCSKRATLFNVVGQPLRFPESPVVSSEARDLIMGLLIKEPMHRLAYNMGATEIKHHPFFDGVNWALIRCATPPQIPKPIKLDHILPPTSTTQTPSLPLLPSFQKLSDNYLEFDFF